MELRIDPNITYALALEGGGAKGAWQIGAWRALREAGIRINAVAGSSVGSLNGALITMGDLEKAEEIWRNIRYSQVMDVDDDAMGALMSGELSGGGWKEALGQLWAALRNGGFDVTPLQNWIREIVDEKKVRESPTELFVVTYSVSDKEELELRARDLPEGELCDMLLASAYFPAFRAEKLGGKRYADGGVRDVLPLHVLIENGYRNILALRLFGLGVERNVRIPKGTAVWSVEPSVELGNELFFDPDQSRENLRAGYYDTMRFLYGLAGKKYFIDLRWSEEACRAFLVTAMGAACPTWPLRAIHEKQLPALAKHLETEEGGYRELLGAALDWAAERIGIDRWKIYTEEELLSAVGGEGAVFPLFKELEPPKSALKAPAVLRRPSDGREGRSVCLLNDSFPPVVDGVANAVVNYAKNLWSTERFCAVATPDYPDAEDDIDRRAERLKKKMEES